MPMRDEDEDLMNKPMDPRLLQYLQGSRINSERGLGANFMAAQAKALSQLGTLKGKTADTSSVTDFAQGIARSAAGDQANDEQMLDRDTKLKQYLLGLKQQRQMKDEDIAARQSANEGANQAKIESARIAAEAKAEQARKDHENKMEALRLQGATQAQIAKMNTDFKKEMVADKVAKIKEPTADQYKAGGFARRVEQAEADFADLKKQGYDRSSPKSSLAATLIPDAFASNEYKRQEQAERNFINAVLRRESGAAISPTEFGSAEKQYFPRANDGPEVLAQKERNRQQTLETLKGEGGAAFERIPAIARPSSSKTEGTATAAPLAPGMVRVISPDGKPGTIPQANLEKAKAKGFREAP